jgi:hypothetical protein
MESKTMEFVICQAWKLDASDVDNCTGRNQADLYASTLFSRQHVYLGSCFCLSGVRSSCIDTRLQ